MLLGVFIITVEAVFNPFMGFHFWGMTTEQLSFLPIGAVVGLVLSIFLIPVLTRRFDKKPILISCAGLTILNINLPIVMVLLNFDWFPASGTTELLLVLICSIGITTFLAPVIFATLNSMFADIADEHELETGERREGILFSARAFALKACGSMGLVFGGVLLDYIAFPRGAVMGEVPEDVVWQLGFIAGPATSLFSFLGLVLYFGYKIDRKRHAEIRIELDSRNQS